MKFTKKISFILLVFLLLLLVFNINNVFAVTNENVVFYSIPDYVISAVKNTFANTYPLSDYNYVIIQWEKNYQVHFVNKDYNIYATSLSKIRVGYNHRYSVLSFNNDTMTGHNEYTSNTGIINFNSSSSNDKTSIYIYSTCDVYTDNTFKTVFFQPVQEVVIPALAEKKPF